MTVAVDAPVRSAAVLAERLPFPRAWMAANDAVTDASGP